LEERWKKDGLALLEGETQTQGNGVKKSGLGGTEVQGGKEGIRGRGELSRKKSEGIISLLKLGKEKKC